MKKLILVILLISLSAKAQDAKKILFTAPWCGPCQLAEKQNTDAVLINVDDADPELLKKYDVVRIPKLIKIKN